MKRMAIFLGLTLVAAGVSALPDPCTLVRALDLQALFQNGPAGPGAVEKHPEIGSATCTYQWGTGSNAYSGRFNFHVTVSELSKTYPGTDREVLKAGLLAETKKPGENAVAISGVGDAAIYKSGSPIRSETTAIVKAFFLQVDLDGPDGRGKKDQVISLLKTAASRM
jgi:hypothetical protein